MKYKKPFSFSDDQKIEAYKLTKSLNGMDYIREMYEPWFIEKIEAQIVLQTIGQAIVSGDFDWTSKKSIVIYTPLSEDIKYISVDFRVKPS